MITEEERQSIINEAVEKSLLMLPETVGNLIANHIAANKSNSKFYADYPEFKDNKDVVTSVVEQVEGEHPFEDYEKLLIKAVPKIRERIATMGDLNLTEVDSNPNRSFVQLEFGEADRPKPHGEI